jgi:Flp pilus assembly pilin Flp
VRIGRDPRDAEGQGLVEYSLILLMVVFACVAIVTQVGDLIKTNWIDLAASLFPG